MIQPIAMASLMLLPAPPLLAQAAPDAGLLQVSAEERLAKIRTEYGVPLSEAETKRIATICKTVQVILQQYHARSKVAAESEVAGHDSIIGRLGTLQAHFPVSQIDYPEFGQVVSGYSSNLDELKTSYELHNTLVNDAATMDCAPNPAGFKAMVAAARAAHPPLAASRTAARSYIANTAIPAIEQIRGKIVEQPNGN